MVERRENASSQPPTRPEPSIESSDGLAGVTGARRGEAAGFGPHLCSGRGHRACVLAHLVDEEGVVQAVPISSIDTCAGGGVSVLAFVARSAQ